MYSYRIIFIVCILYTLKNVRSDILSINANLNTTRLTHFWKSTGFCPLEPKTKVCDYLLSQDIKLNLVLIGALPKQSIKYVRIHWLLDLLTIRNFDGNSPQYNYKCMDLFFDWLHKQNLYPGFEIMGNPSSFFNDFSNKTQTKYWTELIRNIALRYTHKYGIKYVSKWRFETWNEPDLRGYNILNFNLSSYMGYVSATASGLTSAGQRTKPNPTKFKLGGPAGLFKSHTRHPLCWGLISACGASAQPTLNCPLSFISFHKKGDGSAQGVLDKGLQLVEDIHLNYPKLKNLPIANDEADILTGWSKSADFRADVRYAAMITKVIIDHYNKFIKERGIDIEVLSNDNAFLNYHPFYFTQRTLLTRFQMNNTNPPHVQFIKKPVYSTMALLSYLGNRVLNVPASGNFSFLATTSVKNKVFESTVILSYVNDTKEEKCCGKIVDISVRGLPEYDFKYVVYFLNNNESNPYKIWKNFGLPVFPNQTIREKMRKVEGPIRLFPPKILPAGKQLNLNISLLLPTITLIHICSDKKQSPGKVTGLQLFNITTNEVLIIWKDKKIGTKCILSYEIEFLRNQDLIGNGIEDLLFRRVNNNDVVFLWYQFVATGVNGTHGFYRVRAVDYWGRFGLYSNIIKFP